MNYSMLSRLQWIHLGANILEALPRKTEGKKDCLGRSGHGLRVAVHPVHLIGGFFFISHLPSKNPFHTFTQHTE